METSQGPLPRSAEVDDGASKPSSSSGSASRVRRRNRMITSCLECRRRKLKCDRLHPCTNCSKGNRECLFLASSLDSATRLKLAELKERMGTLERSLEVEVTQTTQPAEGEKHMDPNVLPAEEEDLILQPSGVTMMDAMYDDEADDVMVDFGIKLGKMRVTERLGGLLRPRLADEIASNLKSEMQDLPGHEVPKDDGDSEVLKLLELANQGIPLPFLEPGPSFIAPRSDMLLGPSLQEYALLNLLPTKAAADKLLQQYWESCHPITRIMHRPTFEARYQLLWDNVAQGIEPAPSIQAIVFATLFTAAVSMAPSDTLNIFGVDQRSLIESFQLGTESALGKAHFLRSTKTETLQAFVMYLLCFLDIRTAEVQGPRPSIRSEDFTTKFPLNINDEDLVAGNKEESQEWTDMTFARIRFECQEIFREVLIDRSRLEQKKITITGALAKIESSRKAIYERYGPIFNITNITPLQRAASVTLSFMLHRLHIMLLHKFYRSWSSRMPDRIIQLIVDTGTQQLEDAIALETSPDLRPWQWYSRAYHNYHSALLLLVEVSSHPLRREADRIWRCLEYVYEVEDSSHLQNLPRSQIIEHRRRNAHHILRQFRDRMKVYQTLRRIKYTANIDEIKKGQTEPHSLVSIDAVSKEPESSAVFNLNPMTLLPGMNVIEQARARQTQSPHSHLQSQGSVPNIPVMTESRNDLQGNFNESTTQFGAGDPIREVTHDIHGPKSTWTAGPSNSFVQTPMPLYMMNEISPPSSEDMPMPEIDWSEWDKIFPPHLNDGNIDLSPQKSSTIRNEMDPNTMYTFPYPPFNTKLF
ncbi:hypothetical protein UA08_08998 [Talaromyces atroroseus]|uniref:Zn(2)-C6 fungal-type domain-containing protein n=1 Tax=Talaromyces atroroseus TaxID=1441469 RepID=A0A1Q5Q7E6_TALAT|nr:hypothetical protein UA08_08998 [Talaromyces atroroseus]OKL55767.1 hypothetical protein UA08_08998 [Talaromyces atroroseus]